MPWDQVRTNCCSAFLIWGKCHMCGNQRDKKYTHVLKHTYLHRNARGTCSGGSDAWCSCGYCMTCGKRDFGGVIN